MKELRSCGVTWVAVFAVMTTVPMNATAAGGTGGNTQLVFGAPPRASGPAAVNLGTAVNFAILAKTGISTTGLTRITGDIGVSPIAQGGLTGFSETMDSSLRFSTSIYVAGRLYAADYADPTPEKLAIAVGDMETAYTDAAGRTLPDFTELGAGEISSMTLAPGLYKWSTGVHIDKRGVILSGQANDVWIFQIAQDLTLDNSAVVSLDGGARAKNIFWQVGGGSGVTLGTMSASTGTILAAKGIVMNTGATLNGRALVQTAATSDANTVTAPPATPPVLSSTAVDTRLVLALGLLLCGAALALRRRTRLQTERLPLEAR